MLLSATSSRRFCSLNFCRIRQTNMAPMTQMPNAPTTVAKVSETSLRETE
jgi:hypothetical protein